MMSKRSTLTTKTPSPVTVLGIDPGTARMGYGVIQKERSNITALDYGIFSSSAESEDHVRLLRLYKQIQDVIKEHSPDVFAVEDIFYSNNQKTVISVSQARGIALLAAAEQKKQCFSFTPLQVKQAVAGYGQAPKKQVQAMTKNLLNLEKEPKPDDAADALAVAICCAYSMGPLMNT